MHKKMSVPSSRKDASDWWAEAQALWEEADEMG